MSNENNTKGMPAPIKGVTTLSTPKIIVVRVLPKRFQELLEEFEDLPITDLDELMEQSDDSEDQAND